MENVFVTKEDRNMSAFALRGLRFSWRDLCIRNKAVTDSV